MDSICSVVRDQPAVLDNLDSLCLMGLLGHLGVCTLELVQDMLAEDKPVELQILPKFRLPNKAVVAA